MNIQDAWEKALKHTEIVRPRVQELSTFSVTKLSYISLAESAVNQGDTVVRRGEVMVEKPALILPGYSPQFEGFDFGEGLNRDFLTSFFLVRGISFPSLRYSNRTASLDLCEGDLKKWIGHHLEELQRQEDVHTGLITGPEDCWQFSVMVFIASQVTKQAEGDIRKLLDRHRKNSN